MRAAYEAVYARRPLITSGWPIARELFPYALHVEHQTMELVRAFRTADARFDDLVAVSGAARQLQLERFEGQRRMLLQRLLAPSPA